ncbi:1-deoxy-11-beta-hydroxypentalenate dehydrogenase [Pseudoruegeria aquimaris]|uniref:1-deoxy-11-beta-hydroxypentalenate dehydrogenase n=1 Tax=Pseudoruegeria aquimaris TaxID=393663 RepID=A0A1Y5SP78_9RHOB|nr:SDR family NAD(P)-dependent oxidoreductase [Pseudoruegeria aquimaris]SLN42224.1 1-deoxy-11-beta-hydroxypentalenate dehydrogenase [Pseudoruegeria aquimaris]
MNCKKTAVITGGAGGLGRALDEGLRARGWATVLVDLPGPALEGLEELPDRRTMACDLTDASALAALCTDLRAHCRSIDLVIYNAGVTQITLAAETAEAAHRKVFDINYFAAVNMARALIEDLRRARGTHLAISSVAGFAPLYSRTAYAASKHAVEGYFKSLRSEEREHGVRVAIAAPSFVATNIGNPEHREGGISRPGAATDGMDYMPPDAAAEVILKGLEKGRDFIPVGRIARLAYGLNRLSPALYQRLMERNIKGDEAGS